MRTRPGFTLIELLVVIAILAILVLLLLPAIQAAREAARMNGCKNNMRQIGLALLGHHEAANVFPSGWHTHGNTEEPGWGWGKEVLSFMEEQQLFEKVRHEVSVADTVHGEIRRTVVAPFLCPSDVSPQIFMLEDEGGSPLFDVARANYVGNFGTKEIEDDPKNGDGVLFENSRIRIQHILDGTSKTMVAGERSSRLGSSTWVGAMPGAAEAAARVVGSTDHVPNHVHGHFDDFSSDHPRGAHFVFADGHVMLISDQIDENVFKALATRKGGESVPGDVD